MLKHVLYQIKGGSHAYGLETPTSDVDLRGVFLHTDVSHILGIQSGLHDNEVTQNDQQDSAMWELRRFFNLLRGGNSQAVELLFSQGMAEKCEPMFNVVFLHRSRLLDSEKFFKVLKGYSMSELRLANGERTGKLGGKRKEALDKYGFSPKNFVQLYRLLWAGEQFFKSGVFPVRVRDFNAEFHKFLMDVKTSPERFHKDELNNWASGFEESLNKAFDNRAATYKFEEEVANGICYQLYRKVLDNLYAFQNYE